MPSPEPSPTPSGPAETDDDEGHVSSARRNDITRERERQNRPRINTAVAGPSRLSSRRREEDAIDTSPSLVLSLHPGCTANRPSYTAGGLVAAINSSSGMNNANQGSASPTISTPTSAFGAGRLVQREPRREVGTVRVKRTREEKAHVGAESPDREESPAPAKKQKIEHGKGKKALGKKKQQFEPEPDDFPLPKKFEQTKPNERPKRRHVDMGPPPSQASASVGGAPAKERSRVPFDSRKADVLLSAKLFSDHHFV